MKNSVKKHKLFKPPVSLLMLEILALIVLIVLDAVYDFSGRVEWESLMPIYAIIVLVIVSNIVGIRRMRIYLGLYREYANVKDTVMPLLNEMRGTQHDLNNQLQALRQAYTMDEGHPDAVSFYNTLDGNMKKLSLFLKTDKIVVNALLVNKYSEALEKGVELQVDCRNRDLQCEMDDFGLTSVLSNLLQNAIETSPAGSVIRLEMSEEGSDTVIGISNPGKLGGAPEDIFRMGYSSKPGSRGVGLFNVRRIVTGSGGRIEVTQDAGIVKFSVFLPGKP